MWRRQRMTNDTLNSFGLLPGDPKKLPFTMATKINYHFRWLNYEQKFKACFPFFSAHIKLPVCFLILNCPKTMISIDTCRGEIICIIKFTLPRKTIMNTNPWKSPQTGLKSFKVPINNWWKNALHCLLIKRFNGNHVKMSDESGCHVIPTPSRRPHGW